MRPPNFRHAGDVLKFLTATRAEDAAREAITPTQRAALASITKGPVSV